MEEIFDSIKKTIKELPEELAVETPQIAILLHKHPDPDCIGSALGLKKILTIWNNNIHCSIIYDGEISHPQNKTMVNILNVSLTRIEDIPDIKTYADYFICVDCVPERADLQDLKYLATIDHHKNDTKLAQFKDIRAVGATSSIIWEYLNKENITLDKDIEEDSDIATALFIGIKTDTRDLVTDNTTDLDFEAYRHLLVSINQKKMAVIDRYPIPNYHFDLRKRLDQDGNITIENAAFIGGIGYITASKRDALPTIAEERSRTEGIDIAFVYAIVGNDINVSVRCNSLAIDVNTLCQNLFGKNSGGGKMGAGAATTPMGFLSIEDNDEDIQEKMWIAVRAKVVNRILEVMSEYR